MLIHDLFCIVGARGIIFDEVKEKCFFIMKYLWPIQDFQFCPISKEHKYLNLE